MIIKQVTVIVENKEGRFKEVMDLIASEGIEVDAFSMADTVTRLIVKDPEQVKALLEENGYEVDLTDVISVRLSPHHGALSKFLVRVAEEKINFEYMYAYTTGSGMIFLPSDVEKAEKILEDWENTNS